MSVPDGHALLSPGPSPAAAIAHALRIVDENATHFGLRYPDDTTTDQRYPDRPATATLPAGSNYGWTTAFWPGQLWLAHELTGRRAYRDLALAHVDSFAHRAEDRIDMDTHDLGFLYTLSCVSAWRETGSVDGRTAALTAADLLMTRFVEPAGVVQAWGDLDDAAEGGRTIIDSLMNMPLLFWATAQTGDTRYAAAARRHVTALAEHIVRPDGSTFHTFHWDTGTGTARHGSTAQGFTDDSCWARGQAWGVYGFALGFRHTGEPAFLTAARRCADYLLDHLPADGVPYWDLLFQDGSTQPRDSSAAAIAVSGLLELAALVDDDASARYRAEAERLLAAVTRDCSSEGTDSDALLLHGVYHWHKGDGVDEGNLWGDYFYLEALTRLQRPDWVPWWR
ncbi:MAG TPA: glycoside hydrolase family 88 protein [Cellulomonas sp.]